MPTKIDIADTNMALFGSDVEKSLKYKNAQTEPAWKQCGQNEGIEIWRIEKFEVVAWPRNQYGRFFEGDSYIVLQVPNSPLTLSIPRVVFVNSSVTLSISLHRTMLHQSDWMASSLMKE
jgi:hypothetical protein